MISLGGEFHLAEVDNSICAGNDEVYLSTSLNILLVGENAPGRGRRGHASLLISVRFLMQKYKEILKKQKIYGLIYQIYAFIWRFGIWKSNFRLKSRMQWWTNRHSNGEKTKKTRSGCGNS